MEINRSVKIVLLSLFWILFGWVSAYSQSLSSGSAHFTERTSYPVFTPNDPIYYFSGGEGHQSGSLTASSSGEEVTFTWEKYNPATNDFDFILSETAKQSTQSGLSDGCYRVSFNENGNLIRLRSWVINSWFNPIARINESTCDYFKLNASAEGALYTYYDLSSGQAVSLDPSYRFIWYKGSDPFASIQTPVINEPPSVDTRYKVEITDRTGTMKSTEVTYQSIVPTAQFSWTTPQNIDSQYGYPEAPAEIHFKDESVNTDRDKYEWYLFKDKAVIEAETKNGATVDSIMDVLYDVNPIYTYENSGKYKVKLVVARENPELTCRDTFYLENYLVVDTSLVKVVPVFTPNGDGINDEMIIKTRSLESLDFQVFNRWGKMVHQFRKSGYLPEDSELAAWDGRVSGKLVPAGVYYYVVDAKGRDGERRRKKGFVQVIW